MTADQWEQMLGKELAFGVCMPLFAVGVEKVVLKYLKVLRVRRMVRWDWNSVLKIHLKIDDMPLEVYSKVLWGRRM